MSKLVLDWMLPPELFDPGKSGDISEVGCPLRRLSQNSEGFSIEKTAGSIGNCSLILPQEYVAACFYPNIATPNAPPGRIVLKALVGEERHDDGLQEVPVFFGLISEVKQSLNAIGNITYQFKEPQIYNQKANSESKTFRNQTLIEIVGSVLSDTFSPQSYAVLCENGADGSEFQAPTVRVASTRDLKDLDFIEELLANYGFTYTVRPGKGGKFEFVLTKLDFEGLPQGLLSLVPGVHANLLTCFDGFPDLVAMANFRGDLHEVNAHDVPVKGTSFEDLVTLRSNSVRARCEQYSHRTEASIDELRTHAEAHALLSAMRNRVLDFQSEFLIPIGKNLQIQAGKHERSNYESFTGTYFLEAMLAEGNHDGQKICYRGVRP